MHTEMSRPQGMTKTQENALVPKTCAVMSEVADITDTLLKNVAAAPLLAALNDQKIMKHFKSLSVRSNLLALSSCTLIDAFAFVYRSLTSPPCAPQAL